jgi:hypothetical protein
MDHRYTPAAAILLTTLVALSMVAMKTANSLNADKVALQARTIELNSVKANVVTRQVSLQKTRLASAMVNQFMAQWKTAMAPGIDGNALLTDLSRFGTEHTISVQSRKSGASDFPWRGQSMKTQFAEGVGVSGEYYRLINWMGDMEHAWPLARFDRIAFEQKGSSLQLSLRLTYPTFLTEPNP